MGHIEKNKESNMDDRIIPSIGLGTWRLVGDECEKVVQQALEIGYQHIDTADVYQNHQAIGKAIQSWPRKKIFLATKLWMNDLTPERVNDAVPRFLDELKVDYIDLLLIHWPNQELNMADSLNAMLSFKDKGVVRYIGVSNFVRRDLEAIAPYHFPILTNQIELHPFLQRKVLVEACKAMGIQVTAYRPLAKGAFEENVLLQQIGKKHGKAPSQVVLKWLIQKGYSAIPKASSLQHLEDNINIFDFELNPSEMQKIESLDADKRYCTPNGFSIEED